MTDHQPIPVQGYKPQSDESIALANEGKQLEERVLRYLEKLAGMSDPTTINTDKRFVALAKTKAQESFMWAVRSIFQPARAKLPEDA